MRLEGAVVWCSSYIQSVVLPVPHLVARPNPFPHLQGIIFENTLSVWMRKQIKDYAEKWTFMLTAVARTLPATGDNFRMTHHRDFH